MSYPFVKLLHGGSEVSTYEINFDPAGPLGQSESIIKELRRLKTGDMLLMREMLNPSDPCESICHLAHYVVGCKYNDCDTPPDIHQVGLPLAEPIMVDWPMPDDEEGDEHCPPDTGGDNVIYLDKVVDIVGEWVPTVTMEKVVDIVGG